MISTTAIHYKLPATVVISLIAISVIALLANKPSFTYAQKQACQDAIRKEANIPQTVKFQNDTVRADNKDGEFTMRSDFSAKNVYGLELKFYALCEFNNGNTIKVWTLPKW